MGDYCDGTQFKEHPLLSTDLNALQIMLYFDELEVCNPLGTKTKSHNLGMFSSMYLLFNHPSTGIFYYIIGNLRPHLRSTYHAINLLAVGKSQHIEKYGVNAVLKPFMRDLLELEEVYIM